VDACECLPVRPIIPVLCYNSVCKRGSPATACELKGRNDRRFFDIRKLDTVQRNSRIGASHRAKCSLCASPNKARHESDLLSGGDLRQIRRALNVEIKEKTGKTGTVSLKAITRHMELLPYLVPSNGRAKPALIPELSDEDILTLPFAQIKERFQRTLWATCLNMISRVNSTVGEASEEASIHELVENILLLSHLGLSLPDPPASSGSAREGPTIGEVLESIPHPDDRREFIQSLVMIHRRQRDRDREEATIRHERDYWDKLRQVDHDNATT
jgi:hypothetical protein